ncbi:MAG: ribose 5-phosphate isomerase B [Chthonomonadales bacterium]|nr:ribose 5-phosphate isomerase B [Chthonomonadales bacterium]
MRIVIGADHAGVGYKRDLAEGLRRTGHEVRDIGTHDAAPCDYPDFAAEAGRLVAHGEADRGVLICGTGVGMAVSANKIPGVRAASVSEPVTAALARAHNDANIVCIGARIVGPEVAAAIIHTFITTPFSQGERHERRLAKIETLDRARTSGA